MPENTFWCFIALLCTLHRVNRIIAFSTDENTSGLRSTTITIPCVPNSAKKDEMLDLATEHRWTDFKGAELLDSRFSKNEAGDLAISNLHVADSGIYKCKVVAPINTDSEVTTTRVFQHRLLVYELTGHKSLTHVPINMAGQSVESVKTILKDLLSNTVCQQGDSCQPSTVKLETCESNDEETKRCKFAIGYKALNEVGDERCDEECLRSAMVEKLEKAQTVLEKQLTRLANDPQSRVKPDMKLIATNHLLTCEPGFHLIHFYQKHCFPCRPGTYSGPNSFKCNLCETGYYQEAYGKHICNACPKGKTTDTFGSKSSDDCIQRKNNILDTIKNGVFSVFGR